jgi:hypothetical protein
MLMRDTLKRWKKERGGVFSLELNTRLAWLFTATFIAIDIIGLWLTGITIFLNAFLSNVLTVSFLLFLTYIYTYRRPRPRIAALTQMAALFLSFAAATAVCSYLVATGWHQPLVDAPLAAADRALGLDWVAMYNWVKARPPVDKLLYVAYASLIPQIVFLLLYLNFRGRCARCWELLWCFMVSCAICVFLSGLWPAVGAFGHYGVETDRGYVQVFQQLHAGAIRTIGDKAVEGIIQFPSFHVALGIILAYAARGMKILFITFLEINILLFISTPAIGGHHFADLWGGVVLAGLSIVIVRAMFRAGLVPGPEITPELDSHERKHAHEKN